MEGIGNWVSGACVALLGLGALLGAGRADDQVVHLSALGIFVVCIFFIMMLIKLAYEGDKDSH